MKLKNSREKSAGTGANFRPNLEQAKEYLLKTVEDEVKNDTAKLYKELESRAREDANKKAKEYVVTAIQKMCSRPCSRDNDLCRSASE